MLPSAIKAKYTKVFEVVKHNDMDEQLLKFLIPTVNISIKMLKK